MSNYTVEDLQAVRRAKLELARGERVTRFEHNGRKVEYAAADLAKLDQLERSIRVSLRSQRKASRTRYVTSSKGL